MNKGWIKLHRKLADWQWYSDIPATRLLIHLLIYVNYEDKKWQGIFVKAGSMVFSWETLSKSCGLSVRQCRTAMIKLENSKEVTRLVTAKYQVVTLIKWEELQAYDSTATAERSAERQQSDSRATTTKESKENKKVKKLRSLIAKTIEKDKINLFWEWMDYRDSIKKKVVNQKTLEALAKRFNKEPLEKIKFIVNLSIESNYQGLFWDKWRGGNSSGAYKGSNR